MVVAELRSVLALRHASCTSAVRERLMMATAELGKVAAWISYDAERHNDARRLWMIALSIAHQAAHLTIAELTAMQGHAEYTVALATADPKHAARAVPLLREAVEGFGTVYARPRAVNLPGLAGAHTLTGDLDTAARAGHRAPLTPSLGPAAHPRHRPATPRHHPGHQRGTRPDPGGPGDGLTMRSTSPGYADRWVRG
jgi:hypothetical protein